MPEQGYAAVSVSECLLFICTVIIGKSLGGGRLYKMEPAYNFDFPESNHLLVYAQFIEYRISSYLVSAKGVGDDAFCQLQSNFISVSDVVHTTPCKKKEEILEVYYFACIYFFVIIDFPLPLISIQKN